VNVKKLKAALAAWLAGLLIIVSAPAAAQQDEPPIEAFLGSYHGIKFREYTNTLIPQGEQSHVIAHWNRMFTYADSDTAMNTVQYLQHYGWGTSHMFGQVVEVQQYNRKGNSWGIEVDLLTQPNDHGSYKVGVGVVLGPAGLSGNPTESYASHGFMVIPFHGHRARVGYGLQIAVPCKYACVSIPEGEAIEVSPNPTVGRLRFDPKTGIFGMWRADGFLVWGIQQETGQEYRMRRFD
jgi:hypothetical protein